MACGFADKCRHYNAWWCDTNHNSCGTAKKFESDKSAAVSEKACGKELPYKICPRRAGDIPTCYSDPSKAAKELGWTAKRGIDEMCADSWRWQSTNPDGYAAK